MRIRFAFLYQNIRDRRPVCGVVITGGKRIQVFLSLDSSPINTSNSAEEPKTAVYYTCEMRKPSHQNNRNSRLKVKTNAQCHPRLNHGFPSRMASPNNIHPRPRVGEYFPTSPMRVLSLRRAPYPGAEHGPLAALRRGFVSERLHGPFGRHKLAATRTASATPAETEHFLSDSSTCSSSATHTQAGIAGGDRNGFGSGFDVAFCLRNRWQP